MAQLFGLVGAHGDAARGHGLEVVHEGVGIAELEVRHPVPEMQVADHVHDGPALELGGLFIGARRE